MHDTSHAGQSVLLRCADLKIYFHRGQGAIRACIRCLFQQVCLFVLHSHAEALQSPVPTTCPDPGAGCPNNCHVRRSQLLQTLDMITYVHIGQDCSRPACAASLNTFVYWGCILMLSSHCLPSPLD